MARQPIPQESASAPQRPQRTPISARNRLSLKNQDPNYVYRIVNDVDDRVEQLKEQGYEVVQAADVGSVGNKRVDNSSSLGTVATVSVGQGVKAIVMRQRKEWYAEDQAHKQKEIDSVEQTMKQDAKKESDYGSLDFGR